LKVAKECHKITIDPEVLDILAEFYHKLEKSSTEGTIPITERQYHGMFRIAIARAKLHMRDIVLPEDARRAVEVMSRMMLMSGVDPEKGEIDLNILRGKPFSKRQKKDIASAVMELVKDGKLKIAEEGEEEHDKEPHSDSG
jgi:replicative DNA helicase Mcm